MQQSFAKYLIKLEKSFRPLNYLFDEDILKDKVKKDKGKTQLVLDVD
jgi:hypothetical protein